ncbi:hypothetical protein B0A48_08446 [Cryoendolithus antarcticus]|uniref:PARP catalytic domain-containing protein n=1 Tax=Cryoendolithus antarcticus TaxID=1507870 RepID=A0A1V8T5R3_9PEZI|nr:hypothetical protein B0A48_08446 [Cryoendolithus antarcticus]
MPRKVYMSDLRKVENDVKPAGVHSIRGGEDDGQFIFEVACPNTGGAARLVEITAMIPDLSDYPKDHSYVLFCGEDAPPQIAQALQDVRSTDRKSVFELIDMVAATLLSTDVNGDVPMIDSQADDEQFSEDDEADDVYDSEDESFSFGQPAKDSYTATSKSAATAAPTATNTKSDRKFRDRVRSDLRAVKAAGFKVGQLGHLFDGYNAYVIVSIRIAKLGISEEAMQAWQVEPDDYLMLIIQHPNGYKNNEQLQDLDNLRLKPNLAMRVFASRTYKPTLQEAIEAFTKAKSSDNQWAEDAKKEVTSLRETFISRPLTELLESTLVPILRFRADGMDWQGAEMWYNEMNSAGVKPDYVPDKYYEEEVVDRAFLSIVTGDQYRQAPVGQAYYSFPLLAMQFTVRHFARCTEFCMVCHRKLDTDLEAIKPYVCDRPLCLFQYMSMGFGPSIEHEILAQPYVVDLLISFCYTSARCLKLKDLPDGLALMVPPVKSQPQPTGRGTFSYIDGPYPGVPDESTEDTTADVMAYEVGWDAERRELIFFNKPEGGCPVARGSWIVLTVQQTVPEASPTELHCRVIETTFYPTITLDVPVPVKSTTVDAPQGSKPSAKTPATKPAIPVATPKWMTASFVPYNQQFEELTTGAKCLAICKMLDMLPGVQQMKEYLVMNRNALLQNWVSRIPPAAMTLLRWIIASNRACIMQVDGNEDGKKQERLHGMPEYMQFRFAMGAPDKEQRFLSEVRSTKERLALQYPTMFAWHGSPLYNWHSIIREGLHFKNADHGRAYGDGVYHAKDAMTSTSYAHRGYGGISDWPQSVLRVSMALALNEIVNAPKEFTSSNPYYVVKQLDWIQTRYLFVKCSHAEGSGLNVTEEVKPANAHPQDPARTLTGISQGGSIIIPAAAIKSGRAVEQSAKRGISKGWLGTALTSKKQKGDLGDPIMLDGIADDDSASVATDDEDLAILCDEPDDPAPAPVGKTVVVTKPCSASATDFVPGVLDFASLPMLPFPTYATSGTTKRLLSEICNLTTIQKKTPAAELGWYIDPSHIENSYQWIIELHSFHTLTTSAGKPLPLTADLKKAGQKSIVLETRFPPSFPFSPPYIRVLRPHFLSFAQGGGGHIVMGGAMCMELLTNTGWNSVLPMESVLLQVRMAIASEPFARLDMTTRGDYAAGEAAEGYLRACRAHGWQEPEDFKMMAQGL